MASKARRMAGGTAAIMPAPIEPMYSYQTMPPSGDLDGGDVLGILDSNVSVMIEEMISTQTINGGTV